MKSARAKLRKRLEQTKKDGRGQHHESYVIQSGSYYCHSLPSLHVKTCYQLPYIITIISRREQRFISLKWVA